MNIELTLGIFSLLDPGKQGGLEVYMRRLAEGISAPDRQVFWNNPRTILERPWGKRVRRLLPLMTRKRLRIVARWISERQGANWAKEVVQMLDVVHFVGTGWDLAGFPLFQAAKRAGVVMTCWPAVHPGSWGDATLDIDFYKLVDAVFVQSDFEAKHLMTFGVSSEKLVRCGCAPSAAPTGMGLRFRERYNLQGKKIVLFIGRKSYGKGYHALRTAMADLVERDTSIVLVSIGRDLEAPYPLLPATNDIDLGAVDEATKQDALAACDVFVLPSEAESFGIVYIEAWAYGKPVVCGTAPASRELVTKHGGGIVTDGTSKHIAQAIAELAEAPDQAAYKGRLGMEAVEANYSLAKIVDRHLQTWKELRTEKVSTVSAEAGILSADCKRAQRSQ